MGPRDPSGIYPFNLLDLVRDATWAPPNLPLFRPLAPAPNDAPVATSAPAVAAPPWLQPLHELQRVAGTPSPNLPDPTFPDDIAASLWTSNRSSAPGAPVAARPYTGAAAANPYLGSSAGADALDQAGTRRLLERAKSDYDFVRWLSGDTGVRPAQPIQYVAPAGDAPWPRTPTAGIDDALDQPAPFNRPPASSSPRLPLFAAPRRPQGTYWSLLSPSGELLPVTNRVYQQPRTMGDIQPPLAPAPTPDVPPTASNVVRSIATGIPIAGGLANKANAALPSSPDPQASGGILRPLLASRNAQNSGDGILQGLFPDPVKDAEPAATAGGPFGSLLANTSLSVSNAASSAIAPPFSFNLATYPTIPIKSGFPPDQIFPANDLQSGGAWSAAQSGGQDAEGGSSVVMSDHPPRSANDPIAGYHSLLPDHQYAPSLIAQKVTDGASTAVNASDPQREAASDGKTGNPNDARIYAQAQATIETDPELRAAVLMSDNAGDKTFRDRLASIISDLDLDPPAALDAIRQEIFGAAFRAHTTGSAADPVAFDAIRRAVDRLDRLRPNLGILWAREAGYRPAVALSEEQRHTLYSIASNPNLTLREKLDRMADAGLFDSALAETLTGIAGLSYRPSRSRPYERRGRTVEDPRDFDPGRLSQRDTGRSAFEETFGPTQLVANPRKTPGTVTGSGANIKGIWWSEVGPAPIPRQVADKLRGRTFATWDDFRAEFWQTVAGIPGLAGQFSPSNRRLMAKGLAPKTISPHHVGEADTFHLHHVKRVADKGPVYDLDNIQLVSPLQHFAIHNSR